MALPPAKPEPGQLFWDDPNTGTRFVWRKTAWVETGRDSHWDHVLQWDVIEDLQAFQAERDPSVTGAQGRAERGPRVEPLWWTDARTAREAVPANVDRTNELALIRAMRKYWPRDEGSTRCRSDSSLRRFLKSQPK
jgi:hypothetical protein